MKGRNCCRRIAQEQRLSLDELRLALGEWCQCHDHPQLKDWLLEHDAPAAGLWSSASSERPLLIAELQRTHAQRELAELNAQHCRRLLNGIVAQPQDAASQPAHRFGATTRRTTTEILDSLQFVKQQLQRAEEHDRLREELEELRAQLRQSPMDNAAGPFRAAVDRHILGLLGGNPPATLARVAAFRASDPNSAKESVRRYDTMDGTVVEQPADWAEYHVPAAVVRAAIRLAIAESLAQRHEPIPLILDETLDQLEPRLQRAAIAYLSVVAQGKQQIIVLTADEHVAGWIQQQPGAVHYLNRPQSILLPHDINRQLAAYANDAEADKWTHPGSGVERPRPTTRSEYYLNDRSLIERLPSIDATSAVRCRALGIDRVGDLLDADPEWLAEKLDLNTVSQATIRVWQAEARLLCSVRKLRPFDASVLVGAGIRSPRQLSEMHPSQLFDHVERFLATDRGRRILRSGSSFELSRITAWIASANTGSNRYQRSSLIDDERPVLADDEAQPHSAGAAHRSSAAEPNPNRGRRTKTTGRTATRPAGSQRSKSSSSPGFASGNRAASRCARKRASPTHEILFGIVQSSRRCSIHRPTHVRTPRATGYRERGPIVGSGRRTDRRQTESKAYFSSHRSGIGSIRPGWCVAYPICAVMMPSCWSLAVWYGPKRWRTWRPTPCSVASLRWPAATRDNAFCVAARSLISTKSAIGLPGQATVECSPHEGLQRTALPR